LPLTKALAEANRATLRITGAPHAGTNDYAAREHPELWNDLPARVREEVHHRPGHVVVPAVELRVPLRVAHQHHLFDRLELLPADRFLDSLDPPRRRGMLAS